ncbi:MAG: hypothetical protein ACRDRN_00420 [Sciscionella sp.]
MTDPYDNLHATIDKLAQQKPDDANTGLLAFQSRVLVEILDELHGLRQAMADRPPQ